MDTLTLFDSQASLRLNIADQMARMGIPPKTIHHEVGPGQNEIELVVREVLAQCDNTQTTKLIAKQNAHAAGILCTFMPKPFLGQAGSGMHIHQILMRDEENVFAGNEREVSDTLRYYVGGILAHVDEITAITNPTTNSYKRLVPGHEAPVYKSWGVANRTALLRVPGYENKARIEFRATDGATNIYLASALLLAAGIDGITSQIEPNDPTTANVEQFTEQERADLGIGTLPSSLGAALDVLDRGSFARSILGDGITDAFLAAKRQSTGRSC